MTDPSSLPRRVPARTHRGPRARVLALASFFGVAGSLHFAASEFFVAIVPPYLPYHLALVYVSGVCEIAFAAGLLLRSTRRAAGIGLLLLTVAVFPANVHMALEAARFDAFPPWLLYARLPLQAAILWWIWWSTLAASATDPTD